MTKKLVLSVLIGILSIVTTACGSKPNEQQTIAVDAKEQHDSVFSKSVFLGDSLLMGLTDVLNDSHVMSNAGATAQFALKEVDKISNKKPEHVFIMLGSDDLLWPVNNPKEHSLKHYAILIENIKEKIPNAKIHVLSVPPVTKEVMEVEPRYTNIPDYNQALEELAVQEKVDYIDLTSMIEKHLELYKKDGIHFKAEFYPLFLSHIEKHLHSSNSNEGE